MSYDLKSSCILRRCTSMHLYYTIMYNTFTTKQTHKKTIKNPEMHKKVGANRGDYKTLYHLIFN